MRRLVVAIACALALAGCITPSIPIPPPDASQMTFAIDTTAGTATFTYPPSQNYAGSIVYIYNRDQGTGIILDAHADGSVGPSQPVAAAAGNQIVVTFQRDDQAESTCIRLRDGLQDPTSYCD